ncbi:hypothetical protein [Tenacibaculum jejuense]|uniref:Uncharacterized protein n=1 Tax=Tenacibaculum jejuense TaxID=584609 RepID=A0A238U5E9_9FLAO|nr:hypothetical protein [Tenacibaculum jejuense]SNR13838.1 Probable transmembrane protein of unknown function [Tenacibaculum jejuense]
MSNIQEQKTNLVKTVDLDHFKSIYYLLNAKPDSQIRLLKDDKKLNYEDLIELNSSIITKLKTEDLQTSITTITIVFKSKKVSTYNSWAEFERTNFGISDQTLSISLNWDINIKLPEHDLPQRHTLKVRLGSPVRPNEIFQLMLTSDNDEELMEITSNGVCKVDFINAIIANELLMIVEDWYSSLRNNIQKNRIIRFGEKYSRHIGLFIEAIIPISIIVLSYNLLSRQIIKVVDWNSNKINDVLFMLTISIILIFVSSIISKLVSNRIFGKLKSFIGHSMFELTKGDRNSIDEINRINDKNKTGVITQFIIAMVVTIISLFIGKMVDYFLQ